MHSFLTDRQWDWIAQRYHEGYTIAALADFLHVHRETVRRGLIRHGAKPDTREDLIPLAERGEEFFMRGGSHER